jgi:hypothetical protein
MSSRKAIAARAKAFERVVAATWGSHRVPLSGINSRHNAGDVILPTDVSALLECKTRVSSSHWSLFAGAVKDAIKNKVDPERTVLYFKKVGARGHLVTVDGKMFARMLQIPGVKLLFHKDIPLVPIETPDIE